MMMVRVSLLGMTYFLRLRTHQPITLPKKRIDQLSLIQNHLSLFVSIIQRVDVLLAHIVSHFFFHYLGVLNDYLNTKLINYTTHEFVFD